MTTPVIETREDQLRDMIWKQGQLIGQHAIEPGILWFAVDGKVYCDCSGERIQELGDYFVFMETVSKYDVPHYKPADGLVSRLHALMNRHLNLGSKYERAGNTKCSIQCRKVGNLLAAFLRGVTPTTVCPDFKE